MESRHSVPGVFAWRNGLKLGPHVGWTQNEVGLHAFSGTIYAVPRDRVPPYAGLPPLLARAAAACPLVCVLEPTGSRVLTIEWSSATSSGVLHDSGTGRRCAVSLYDYSTQPMPLTLASAAVDALTSDFLDERERAEVSLRLSTGCDPAGLEELREWLELDPVGLDELIRHVSAGAYDEAAVDFAATLIHCVPAAWERELCDALVGPAVELPAWLRAANGRPGEVRDSLFGRMALVPYPAVSFPDGTVIAARSEWVPLDRPNWPDDGGEH